MWVQGSKFKVHSNLIAKDGWAAFPISTFPPLPSVSLAIRVFRVFRGLQSPMSSILPALSHSGASPWGGRLRAGSVSFVRTLSRGTAQKGHLADLRRIHDLDPIHYVDDDRGLLFCQKDLFG